MSPQTPDDAPVTTEEIDQIFSVDTATVHKAEEDPIFSLPVTDNNIYALN